LAEEICLTTLLLRVLLLPSQEHCLTSKSAKASEWMPSVLARVCTALSCPFSYDNRFANMLNSLDAFDPVYNDNRSNGTVQRCPNGSSRTAQRGGHLLRVPGKCWQ
jgi:hypothetical protein